MISEVSLTALVHNAVWFCLPGFQTYQSISPGSCLGIFCSFKAVISHAAFKNWLFPKPLLGVVGVERRYLRSALERNKV